jgi:zinc transport system permease protein
MMEVLGYSFMQNALTACVLASVACGLVGSLVVVNRLVFLAGGVAHAAYGGVGLAFFAGWPVLPCTVGFTLAASGAMGLVTLKSDHRRDTLIGVLWAAGMAAGILLLDFTPGYKADLMSFLFGSILAVPASDLWLMLVLDLVLLAAVLVCYKNFLAMAYDYEFARARGAPVAALHLVLLALVAVSVVMVIRVVGLILVIALLTIPPFMAERRSSSLGWMMFRATLLSMTFCLAGLAAAYALNLTSGASIIAVATLAFSAALAKDALAGRIGRNAARSEVIKDEKAYGK